jgi:hypothetical protein
VSISSREETSIHHSSKPIQSPVQSAMDSNLSLEKALTKPKSLLVIDPNGRLFLTVGPPETQALHIQVSQGVFALASPVWKRMLNQATNSNQGSLYLALPSDDIRAVTILLHIAHLNFGEVPLAVTFHELFQLAIHSREYELTGLCRPFYPLWKMKLSVFQYDDDAYLEQCFVSWVFKDFQSYSYAFERLILSIGTNQNRLFPTEDDELCSKIPRSMKRK